MRLLTRVITLAVIVFLFGGGIYLLVTRVVRPRVGESFHTWAMFRDGSGLPVGSQVVIAGVRVGEISELGVQGRLARVTMRLKNDVVIWNDAFAAKRASSLLGDSYIEILPGGPTDDAAPDAKWRRLKSGEPILQVLEGGSTEEVLRTVDTAMPRIDTAMASAQQFLLDGRRYVSGPLTDAFESSDQWLARGAIAGPVERGARGARSLAEWTAGLAETSADVVPKINPTLDGYSADLESATRVLATAQVTLRDTLTTSRARMDDVDPYVDRVTAVLDEYAGDVPPEEQGAIALLINDDELGETLHDTTTGLRGYTDGLAKARAWMGLRAEYNVLSGVPRLYVIAEINTRTDKFYLIELEKGGLGQIPDTTLSDEPGSSIWTLRSTISERIRFSAMFGKKIGPARFRFGFKESTIGVGADLLLFDQGRLRLSADVFDATFSRLPRVKLAASFAIFRYIYFVAGVDDAINPGGYLPIAPWPAAQDVPTTFREIRYGRDYFFGAMLNITDADLATMLRVYGALIIAGLR